MFGKKTTDSNIDHTITTLIGEGCTIQGNIASKDYIKIDGNILGDLTVEGGVILGEKGHITGNVRSNEVIAYGKIEGDVHADSLHLKSSCSILGNIETQRLQIDSGAVYQGGVTMQKSHSSASTSTAHGTLVAA